MTIRGGGNPHSAMAAMPLREWTRRLGALPAEAYDCFMVCTPYGSTEYKRGSRDCSRPMAGSPRIIARPRDGDGNMRSGRKNARGAARTKEWNDKRTTKMA
jgi:hypothetical protein